MHAFGIIDKILHDYQYKYHRCMTVISEQMKSSQQRPFNLEDFTGAFLILFVGNSLNYLI